MNKHLAPFRKMYRIRRFEETLLKLFRDGELRGTSHVCIGQEAVAAGACAALGKNDYVTSNHRGHGHMLARGADMKRVLAEIWGKETGYALGRGGSQHIAAFEVGFLGSNGITGGGLPIAVGAGLSLQMRKVDGVCLCFFGDGASAQGTFHESMNLAMLWKLPVIFLCENNHYAMGTHVSNTCPADTVFHRALGYDMPRVCADGNDYDAVLDAVTVAREHAAAGKGPYFVEALTYRITGHSRSDMCHYRPKEEEEPWLDKDPVSICADRLIHKELASREEIDAVMGEVEEEVAEAVSFARESEELPAGDYDKYVYPAAAAVKPAPNPDGFKGEASYAEAIYRALADALGDESVVLIGEDIADYEGAFKVTRDLYKRFGSERVRNTPISENTIVGTGTGAAITGMRPVVEIMFMDFILLALDQIINHAAKFSYIFGGQSGVPLTIRTPAGGRRGYGATHSQCFESMLLSVPGLKIFTPYSVQDAYDLLMSAIYDDGPVLFVEHKLLYSMKGELDTAHTLVEPGKAAILREGSDLSIVSYSHMTGLALQAAEYLAGQGISAEVIDLRTITPLDFETISASAIKTQRVIIAEEGVRRGGVGSEIAARLQDECFGYLDAPVLRVGAKDTP
ncbi:MAG: dehydrogenase E1 component subunit alpha/beta, partial [Planctomycetes bacterium]|nr:dehydrogenase E1 component subunit alpha/beta [Planctomycetota bacterium]